MEFPGSAEIQERLIALIVRSGGKVRTSDAYEVLADEFALSFRGNDAERRRWENNVRAARWALVEKKKIKRECAGGKGVWEHMDSSGHSEILVPLNRLERELISGLEEVRRLSARELRQRARGWEARPERVRVVATAFRRNPWVIAVVLDRAKGNCESCGHEAPFVRRSDGSPYLEVQHKVQLADGGEDTVENAVALCPNCHRKAHLG